MIIDATSSTAGTAVSMPAQGKANRNQLPSNAHAAEKAAHPRQVPRKGRNLPQVPKEGPL